MARDIAEPYLALNRWKTFEKGNLPIEGHQADSDSRTHARPHGLRNRIGRARQFVVIGDTVHVAAVQFARPDAAVSFDSDPKQAVATRKAIFRRVADGKTFVADMHIAFPGIGRLRSDGKNGYVWAPIEYSPLPAAKPAAQ